MDITNIGNITTLKKWKSVHYRAISINSASIGRISILFSLVCCNGVVVLSVVVVWSFVVWGCYVCRWSLRLWLCCDVWCCCIHFLLFAGINVSMTVQAGGERAVPHLCTVLNCTPMYSTVMYWFVLNCTELYCTVLYCTVLYSNLLLSHKTVMYSTIQ